MKNFLLFIITTICASCFCSSCNNLKDADSGSRSRIADSTEIVKLLHNAYKWHGTEGKDIIDFQIIVKDSFQVGVDTAKSKQTLTVLKKTNYFSSGFLENYQKIWLKTDSALKHGKYYNEINFSFQDADPWTFFQDDAGNYWDSLKISDMALNADTASLKWMLGGKYPTDKYMVKLKRESNVWKISYLQGFDIHQINEN
jgi:hypothetical protein